MSTGQLRPSQIFSLCASVLSLSWGASRYPRNLQAIHHVYILRSYLIQRLKDKSDPDPKVSTVGFHIWPLMLIVTVAKLTILSCAASLLGPYIFLGLALLFLINYALLYTFCKKKMEEGSTVDKSSEDPEAIPLQQNNEESEQKLRTVEEEDFILTAAVCSIWLPSVVGDQSRRIYLVSGVTSLVGKVLLLAIAVGLAASGLQQHVYKRPGLLFCFEENSPLLTEEGIVQCSYSKGDCFPNKNATRINQMRYKDALTKMYTEVLAYQEVITEISKDTQSSPNQLYNASTFLGEITQTRAELDELVSSTGAGKVQQKVRVCEENENLFRLCLLLGLLVVVALAAYSIYMLHKIADYEV